METVYETTREGLTLRIVHDDDAYDMNPLTSMDTAGRIVGWGREVLDGCDRIQDPEDAECPRCEGYGGVKWSEDLILSDYNAEPDADGCVVCPRCSGSSYVGDLDALTHAEACAAFDSVDAPASPTVLAIPLRYDTRGTYSSTFDALSDWSEANAAWLFTAADLASGWFPHPAEGKGGPGAGEQGARAYVAAMADEIAAWLEGDVYGFEIEDAAGNHLDSCWGFIDANAYSGDPERSHVAYEGLASLDYAVGELERRREANAVRGEN